MAIGSERTRPRENAQTRILVRFREHILVSLRFPSGGGGREGGRRGTLGAVPFGSAGSHRHIRIRDRHGGLGRAGEGALPPALRAARWCEKQVSAYGSLRSMRPESVAEEARELLQMGFEAYKVKIAHADIYAELEAVNALAGSWATQGSRWTTTGSGIPRRLHPLTEVPRRRPRPPGPGGSPAGRPTVRLGGSRIEGPRWPRLAPRPSGAGRNGRTPQGCRFLVH
jgi:hypothetical protein